MQAAEYQPLGQLSPQIFGLPVEREILFSNHKNVYKKRIEKRQRKLIVKTAFIKPFLKRSEKILLVTTGYSPLASLAQYLTGFVFVYLKRSMFIFTNYRIFHVPTTSAYKYKNSIAQIAYAGCQSIVMKGGTLHVQYAKYGKIEKFRSLAVPERKKVRTLLKKNIPLSGVKSQLAERIHLCPRCFHRLTPGKYRCEKCQLKFKNKFAAAIISFFFPGFGYFYTRHYLIGFLDALSEVFLIVYLVYIVLDFVHHVPVDPVHLTVIPLIFIFVKTATLIHSVHFINEFIPTSKDITASNNLAK